MCFIFFGYRKSLEERVVGGGGQCQYFPLKISCLTVPKNAVGEPFSHSLFSGFEKVWIRGGGAEEEGSVTNFCRKLFVSQC